MHKVGLVISLKQQKAAQQIGGHAKDDVETETRAEMVGAHAVLKFRSSLAAARSHLLWLLALASEPGIGCSVCPVLGIGHVGHLLTFIGDELTEREEGNFTPGSASDQNVLTLLVKGIVW